MKFVLPSISPPEFKPRGFQLLTPAGFLAAVFSNRGFLAAMRFRFPAVLSIGILTASCTSPVTPEVPAVQSSEPREAGGDLSQAKIPVLRSSYFEKNWGLPDITTFTDGGYCLRFRQGTSLNYVFIYGLVDPKPVPAVPPDWSEESFNDQTGFPTLIYHKQPWRQTSILGTPVKWYQNDSGGGADFPCYKTVDFALTAPTGKTGHYRIVICSDTSQKAADWIKRVNW